MPYSYQEIEKLQLADYMSQLTKLQTEIFEVKSTDPDDVPELIIERELERLSREENYLLMKICEIKGIITSDNRNSLEMRN